MVQGKRIHETLHQLTNQVNYSPTEVCNVLPQLKLKVAKDIAILDQHGLQLEINSLTQTQPLQATIIILPPDKSVFLGFQNRHTCILWIIKCLCKVFKV